MCIKEREKREHEEKEAEKARKKEKKSQPGFDGRWYTDADSHLQQKSRLTYINV